MMDKDAKLQLFEKILAYRSVTQSKPKNSDETFPYLQDAAFTHGTNTSCQSYKHTAKKTDEVKQSTKKALLEQGLPSSDALCLQP